MRLKLTYSRAGRTDDLLLTCDAASTVGDVADHLVQVDPRAPQRPTGPHSLAVVRGDGTDALDPRTTLAESGLRSGSVITVVASARVSGKPATAAAQLVVLDGPDRGREFALHSGSNLVGRGRGCEARLTDLLVSREHARVNITDGAEIIDLGSANGVQVDGATIARSPLRSTDRAQVGDTVFAIRVDRRAGGAAPQRDSTATGFIRSPRLVPPYPGEELAAPEVPQPPQTQRFPLLGLLAPVVMGVVLYLITRQVLSLAFIALSPLLLIGNWAEQRWSNRAVTRRQRRDFEAALIALDEEVEAAHAAELEVRLLEHPSAADCVAAIVERSPLLWTRRADAPALGDVRFGVGRVRSRSKVVPEGGRRGQPDLRRALMDMLVTWSTIDDAPVPASPLRDGPIGFAGPRSATVAAARAAVLQWVSLHCPDDLCVAVIASSQTAEDWDWIKWLPHCAAATSPVNGHPLTDSPVTGSALLTELEGLVSIRLAADRSDDAAPSLPMVVVVAETDAPVDFARLVALSEIGWRVGVVLVWVAPELAALPSSCRTYLELKSLTDSAVGYVHSGLSVTPVLPELVDRATALAAAQALCPVTDLAARAEDASDLPRTVPFLSRLVSDDVSTTTESAIQRWTENRSILSGPYAPETPAHAAGTLRAVIGYAAGQPHAVDLRAHGPHALVGGTTGSGKSELLQTWILAMAANHSPQRLSFLLVDYKGGAAFAECNELPHTVGMVTDLDPKGVRRALDSLRAELHLRETILARHRVKDLVAMEEKGLTDAPPSLVIVVDEFAALATEVPEFVEGVVDIAQRGRSLGLHLVLATQRPSGVIKGSLRANTNLRIALRVADVDDSTDVLGGPEAAMFDPDIPGRAVSKIGPGRMTSFQTAYAGGQSDLVDAARDIEVAELGFQPDRRWVKAETGAEVVAEPGPSDLARVVVNLREAFQEARLPTPRRPWMPELDTLYNLSDQSRVPSPRRDTELVYGVSDDPSQQAQPLVAFRPDVDGNLVVYGTGGSGKSTFLRTIAAAAGFARYGACQVYGLDFGSRGLTMLDSLPHVGSVIAAGDDERVRRLLSRLAETIVERAQRYQAVGAGTISEYRQRTGEVHEPRILLLLDGLAAFRQAYELGVSSTVWDWLINIANDGRPCGVHLVLSADRPGALPTTLASAVQRRVVLRMADANDYALFGLPADVLTDTSPPGRGLVGGKEVQVAVLGRHRDTAGQVKAMKDFGKAMLTAGVSSAPPIERLPEVVNETSLPASVEGRPVLGLASATLQPVTLPTSGGFVVAGPPGSGRTTAFYAVARAWRRSFPGGTQVLLSHRRTSEPSAASQWDATATGPEQIGELAAQLTADLDASTAPATVSVFIEGTADLIGGALDTTLAALINACQRAGALVVAEGDPSTFSSTYGPIGLLKANRAGLALQPDPSDGLTMFKTPFPNRMNRADFPPGRGLLVGRGVAQIVQVMLPST